MRWILIITLLLLVPAAEASSIGGVGPSERYTTDFTQDPDFLWCSMYRDGADELADDCQADGDDDGVDVGDYNDSTSATDVPDGASAPTFSLEPADCGTDCINAGFSLDEDKIDGDKFDFDDADSAFCFGGFFYWSDANPGNSLGMQKLGEWGFRKSSTEKLQIRINGAAFAETSTNHVILDTWYHAVFCHDMVSDVAQVYSDGLLMDTTTTEPIDDDTDDITIGTQLGGDVGGVNDPGWMAETFIVDRLLEDAEICCHCRFGTAGDLGNRVAECDSSCAGEQKLDDGTLVCR